MATPGQYDKTVFIDDFPRARHAMSQYDDTFKAQKRATAHKLSTPHMRALRKELLIARADVERMELAQASADLRYKVSHFSVLSLLMPGRRKRGRASGGSGFMSRLGGLSSLFGGGGGGLGLLLKQYPVVSSLASLVLTKPVRSRLLRARSRYSSGAVWAWSAGKRIGCGNRSSQVRTKPSSPDVAVDPDA